jgi:hypothetical protein
MLCNLSCIAKLTHQGPIDRTTLVTNGERLEWFSMISKIRGGKDSSESALESISRN